MHSSLSSLWTYHLKRRCGFNPAALLRLRGSSDKVFAELEEMKEEAAHTHTGVTIQEFFKKRRYKQPIIIVLVINLGSQLSGFNAVSLMKCNSSVKRFLAKLIRQRAYW